MHCFTHIHSQPQAELQPPRTSLPSGPRLPGLLQGLSYLLWEERMVKLVVRKYGDVFTVRMPSLGNVVVIADPDLVRRVFTVAERFLEVGDAQQPLEVLYGPTSVLLSDGAGHRYLRRLLVPPLRRSSIERYRQVIAQAAERMLASWPVGVPFAMLPQMRELSCEIILRVVLGIEHANELERWSVPFRKMLALAGSEQMTVRYSARALGGLRTWRTFNRARAECDALIYEEIGRRRGHPDPQADDVLGVLLRSSTHDGRQLDDLTLRDQLMTLIVGGHETPAGALAWAFERLVRHPQMLERLAREALDGGDSGYAEAVIHETLRVRPPLAFVARRVKSPFRLGDHVLAPGTVVLPYFMLIHGRADLYPEPQVFRPERFLKERPPAYGWVPFGGGAHACLGAHFAYLEIKTILHTVLRGVELATVVDQGEPVVRKTITYIPKHGARVTVKARL